MPDPIDPAWFNCSNCGNRLIKKVEVIRNCPMCGSVTVFAETFDLHISPSL